MSEYINHEANVLTVALMLVNDGEDEAGKPVTYLADAAAYIHHLESEVASVLAQLDELAELWGDAAKFRRCRDRLRAAVAKGGG